MQRKVLEGCGLDLTGIQESLQRWLNLGFYKRVDILRKADTEAGISQFKAHKCKVSKKIALRTAACRQWFRSL